MSEYAELVRLLRFDILSDKAQQAADAIEARDLERTQFILTMQQHQPSGSPPSGTLDMHLRWVLESLGRERDAAVADNAALLAEMGSVADNDPSNMCVFCEAHGGHDVTCVLLKAHPGAAVLARMARLEAVAEAAIEVHSEVHDCVSPDDGERCPLGAALDALDAAEQEASDAVR